MYGGVVPEIASRKHVECVSLVLKETLQQAHVTMEQIDAICVTKGPGTCRIIAYWITSC